MIRADLIAPIGALIGRQANERPDAVAFVDKTRQVTYGALADRTARLAGHLQAAGVQPGQSVALFLPHGVNWVEACFAIMRADAVVVPISTDSTDNEIAYRLADATCVAVIANTDQAARFNLPAIKVASGDTNDFESIARTPSDQTPRDPTDINQPSFIVYTSGTT